MNKQSEREKLADEFEALAEKATQGEVLADGWYINDADNYGIIKCNHEAPAAILALESERVQQADTIEKLLVIVRSLSDRLTDAQKRLLEIARIAYAHDPAMVRIQDIIARSKPTKKEKELNDPICSKT